MSSQTHLIIRDGSLIPIAGTYISRDGNTITFHLADGSNIAEVYGSGEPDAIAAYDVYNYQIMGDVPRVMRLIDVGNQKLTTVYVQNGILQIYQ